MSTLVVDQVSKSFGDIKALNRVSFDCKEGEFVVIVGPSGAGKTTTLNCISGVEHPEEGTIYIDDQDVTVMSPQDHDIAMVFESYAFEVSSWLIHAEFLAHKFVILSPGF